MAKDSIKMTPEALDELAKKFSEGADIVGNIMKEVKGLEIIFTRSYRGFASEINKELYSKINQHLDTLKSCYSNTADYVTDVKTEMQEVDKAISQHISNLTCRPV